jgi:hypothetical protein
MGTLEPIGDAAGRASRRRFLAGAGAVAGGSALSAAALVHPAAAPAQPAADTPVRELLWVEKSDRDWTTNRVVDANARDLNLEPIPALSGTCAVAERPVLVELNLPVFRSNVTDDVLVIGILEDGAIAGCMVNDQAVRAKSPGSQVVRCRRTPSAGDHVYAAAVGRLAGSGTVTVGVHPLGMRATLSVRELVTA